MSDTFLKCSCRTCDGHIEFPSYAVGRSIACPHCGANTDLYAAPPLPTPRPAAPPSPVEANRPASLVPSVPAAGASRLQVAGAAPPPPPLAPSEHAPERTETVVVQAAPTNWIGWSLAVLSVLLVLIGCGLYLRNVKEGKSVLPSRTSLGIPTKSSKAKSAASDSQETSDASASSPKTVATPSRSKSPEDLKVGPIVLQKKQGTSLVHAVGTLRNESDYQRFGVTVELDLLDSAGKRVAGARDYIAVIEPRKEWRFKALVVTPRIASVATVRIARIKEEE